VLDYIDRVEKGHEDVVTVILPESFTDHWWDVLLHNNAGSMLKFQLPGRSDGWMPVLRWTALSKVKAKRFSSGQPRADLFLSSRLYRRWATQDRVSDILNLQKPHDPQLPNKPVTRFSHSVLACRSQMDPDF
jgi:hypothetical protein